MPTLREVAGGWAVALVSVLAQKRTNHDVLNTFSEQNRFFISMIRVAAFF
jgi:hypothetical protein